MLPHAESLSVRGMQEGDPPLPPPPYAPCKNGRGFRVPIAQKTPGFTLTEIPLCHGKHKVFYHMIRYTYGQNFVSISFPYVSDRLGTLRVYAT